MVPEGWQVYKVADCLEKVVDSVSPEADKLYQEIGIRSHAKGIFHKELVTGKSLGNKRVFKVHPDCFVVNIVFAWEQAIAMTSNDEVGMIASHRFPMFKPKKNRCDINYITYFFKTPRGKYLLELASPGGAGRNKTLGQNEFARVELTLPPTREQKKIANILSTWDQAIEVTEKLLSNSRQQKKSLMQQLLTGKARLKRFGQEKTYRKTDLGDVPEGWGCGQLLEYLKTAPKYGINAPAVKLTENIPAYLRITDISEDGIYAPNPRVGVNQPDHGNYKLEVGDLVFARTGASVGKSYIYRKEDGDLVYAGFLIKITPDSKILSPQFLFQYVKSWSYWQWVKIMSMRSGQPGINGNEYGQLPMLVPTIKEQKEIVSVLSAADKEIEALQKKLECLRQEKKALMQQLLTGKRRVKIDEGTTSKGAAA